MVDLLSGVIVQIANLAYQFAYMFWGPLAFIISPVYFMVFFLYEDITLVYNTLVTTINSLINLFNWGGTLLGNMTPSNLPGIWVYLFGLLLSLQSGLTIYRCVRIVKSWIPTISGGG